MSEQKHNAELLAVEYNHVAAIEAGRIALDGPVTLIGGKCNAGKTKALDLILAALTGQKAVPTRVIKDNEELGEVKVILSTDNGELEVKKTFRKDGEPLLKVKSQFGTIKAGQTAIDALIDPLAIDTRPFMALDESSKAEAFLKAVGVNTEEIDQRIKQAFEDRKYHNRQLKQAEAKMEGLTFNPEVGLNFPKTSEIVDKLQKAREHNAQLDDLKQRREKGTTYVEQTETEITNLENRLAEKKEQLAAAEKRMNELTEQISNFEPIDTTRYETVLDENEMIQQIVQQNQQYKQLEEEKDSQYQLAQQKEAELEEARNQKKELMANSDLPETISVIKDDRDRNVLTFKGDRWDTMSSSDRYFLALTYSRLQKPDCGFVLADGLECFDTDKLKVFRDFVEAENLKVLGTKVTSSGEDCDFVIEEGRFLERNGTELKPQNFEPEEIKVHGYKKKQQEANEQTPTKTDNFETPNNELPDF